MSPPTGHAEPSVLVARLRGNYRRIQWINFFWMFLVIMPVVVPFWQSHGLDMQQVYLLQTVFAVLIVALEVPSGYLADHLGRKTSLVLAGAAAGCAFTWFAFADNFRDFLLFEVFAAVGASLYSGSDVALIYDTDDALHRLEARAGGETRRAREAIASLGRRLFYAQSGETLAAIAGGLLVLVSLELPARVNAVTAWAPFFIALGLIEPPREVRSAGLTHIEKFRSIGRILFRESRLLAWVLANLIVYGLASLTAAWAFQGLWMAQGIPLAAFGWLWALYNLTVAVVGRAAHSMEERFGSVPVVVTIGLLPVIGFLGMAWSGAVLGVVFGLAFQVSRGLTQVVLRDALNARVPTDYRATANSFSTLGVRSGFAAGGPFMGWMIDGHGYPTAFTVFAGVYVVFFFLVCLPLVAQRKSFRPVRG